MKTRDTFTSYQIDDGTGEAIVGIEIIGGNGNLDNLAIEVQITKRVHIF